MINHFLVLAKRTLHRNSFFTLVNIISLAVGLSVGYYSALFVYNEFSYEIMHAKSDRIARLTMHINDNNYDMHWARQDRDYINALPEEISEIRKLIRFQNYYPRNVVVGNKAVRIKHGFSTDADVFEVFDFNLLKGNPEKALEKPNSVVLSESTAYKLFGDFPSYGQTIAIVNDTGTREEVYQITGIMEDLPSNTHLPVNMLTSFSGPEERTGWAYTYLLLSPGQDTGKIQEKIDDYVSRKGSNDAAIATYPLQPLESIHLNSSLAREIQPNANESRVLLIGGAGLVILILCVINFLNLTAAQSLRKVKEISVRKIMGATRKNLSEYFFIESLVLCLLAGISGAGILVVFSEKLQLLNSVAVPLHSLWPLALVMIVIIASAATCYPSLVLSNKNILVAMKSKEGEVKNKQTVKNSLVALQLIMCVMLISATLVTRKQYEYLVSKDLGINKSQLVAITNLPQPVKDKYLLVKDQLSKVKGVQGVTASMEVPSREIRDAGPVSAEGVNQDEENLPVMDIQLVDQDFINLLGIDLLAGDHFTLSVPEDAVAQYKEDPFKYLTESKREYIINETALKQLGFNTPGEAVGRNISWGIGDLQLQQGPIVGVIKDYHQENLRNKIDPVVMTIEPYWIGNLILKLNVVHP